MSLKGEDLVITGTGKETRDFTYVDDLIDLMLSAALSSAKDGEIFNGGTGSKTEVANMAEIIKEVAESQSNLVFKPARNWDKVKDRVSDLSKSASELGYTPKVNIREGLEKTIKWYKDNYDKVKSLKNYFE